MNKIISVNIGGIVFQIDEQAYRKLGAYLEALKTQFSTGEGGDEIIRDIELRIAEIFQEKLEGRNEAIFSGHVEEVIEIMGKPEEYDEPPTDDETITIPGYRQGSDYVPRKRFLRNPDDKVLGGVCSGFAAYVNIDPLVVRIIFILIVFAFGSGILIYLILWILIPEATTTAQKLQMRGEKVNIDTIQKAIKEESEDLKARFKEFGSNQSASTSGLRRFFEGLFELIGSLAGVFFKLLAIVIIVVVLIALTAMLLGLVGAVNVFTFHNPVIVDYIFTSDLQRILAMIGITLILVIPLFVLLIKGVTYLLNIRRSTRAFDFSFLLIWIAAVIMVSVVATQISMDFQRSSRYSQKTELEMSSEDLVYVKLDRDSYWMLRENYEHMFDIDEIEIYDDTIAFTYVELDIEKSEDSTFSLVEIKSAHSRTKSEARSLAKDIRYNYSIDNNILYLPRSFSIGEDSKWRKQELELVLYVPEGKSIVLDQDLDRLIDDIELEDYLPYEELYDRRLVMGSNGLTLSGN